MDRKISALRKENPHIDIKRISADDTAPNGEQSLGHKRTGEQKRFYLGRRTVGHWNNHQRRALNGSTYHQNQQIETTLPGILHAIKKYLPQPWRFFSGWNKKTMRHPKNTGKNFYHKKLRFQRSKSRRPISNFITSITNKKLREKLIREKTLKMKTTVELITQNSYDWWHKPSNISLALAKDKDIKQEHIQTIEARQRREQLKRKVTADSAASRTGHPT